MTDVMDQPSTPTQATQQAISLSEAVRAQTFSDGMSWDDFSRIWDEMGPFELINGEVVPVGTKSYTHIRILRRLNLAINNFAAAGNLGEGYTEGTFIRPGTTNRNWVRGSRIPDFMFYAQARLDAYDATLQESDDARPPALIPDLVVEVISKTDGFFVVEEKIEGYLQDGVQLVWVITPPLRLIYVHSAGSNSIQKLGQGQSLAGGDVLPGFTLAVNEVFALG